MLSHQGFVEDLLPRALERGEVALLLLFHICIVIPFPINTDTDM